MIKLDNAQVAALVPASNAEYLGRLLIDSGLYEEKPENPRYPEAVYSHWVSGLYNQYGESWVGVANERLLDMRDNHMDKVH